MIPAGARNSLFVLLGLHANNATRYTDAIGHDKVESLPVLVVEHGPYSVPDRLFVAAFFGIRDDVGDMGWFAAHDVSLRCFAGTGL